MGGQSVDSESGDNSTYEDSEEEQNKENEEGYEEAAPSGGDRVARDGPETESVLEAVVVEERPPRCVKCAEAEPPRDRLARFCAGGTTKPIWCDGCREESSYFAIKPRTKKIPTEEEKSTLYPCVPDSCTRATHPRILPSMLSENENTLTSH